MDIDWFTVVAQLVNFLVLLVILKFALFNRIVAAIDARGERLAAEQAAAQAAEAAAEADRVSAAAERREVERQHAELLRAAKAEAHEHGRALEREARARVAALEERLRAELRDSQRELVTGLVRTATVGVGEAVRRVLAELSDADFDQRMVERLCARLEGLDDSERAALAEAWGDLDGPLLVTSTRALSEAEREQLRRSLARALAGPSPALRWERSDALVCGVEITGAGRSIAWSIDGYLTELEDQLEAALAEDSQSAPTLDDQAR